MVELIFRLVAASLCGTASALGYAPPLLWQSSALFSALSIFGWLILRRRLANGGIAGFLAVADAGCIAAALASAGLLDRFGFLVAIPCLMAAARSGAPAISMAPLASTALVGADALTSRSGLPGQTIMAQALAVLVVCFLAGQRVHKPEVDTTAPAEEDGEPLRQPQLVEDGFLQLRESYRRLRDSYKELERRAESDRIVARFAKHHDLFGPAFYRAICKELKTLTGADEVAIYTLSSLDRLLSVRGYTEDFPDEWRMGTLQIYPTAPASLVLARGEDAISALASGREDAPANFAITSGGRCSALISMWSDRPDRLQKCRRICEAANDVLAKEIALEQKRTIAEERLGELDLLYSFASIVPGASSPTSLSERFVSTARERLNLDFFSIATIEDEDLLPLAGENTILRFFQSISFAVGEGLPGWLGVNAPEIVIGNVREDDRCPRELSLKLRIGSCAFFPIFDGDQVVGIVAAGSSLPGGVGIELSERLRLVSGEFARSLERLGGKTSGSFMTPAEFSTYASGRQGCLVFMEPIRRDELIKAFGKEAFDAALEKAAVRIRTGVPAGGAICKRSTGDFVCFLECDEEFARRWANETTATSSLVTVQTVDGQRRMPFPVRAKVAAIGKQIDQVLEINAA